MKAPDRMLAHPVRPNHLTKVADSEIPLAYPWYAALPVGVTSVVLPFFLLDDMK